MVVYQSLVGDWLAKTMGGQFREVVTSISTGLPPNNIVAQRNPERVWLGLVNQMPNDVWISTLPNVATNVGIRLGGGGGIVVFSLRDDFLLPSLEWIGVYSLGGGFDILRVEVIRDTRVDS
jgi:hypothetical protein